MVSLFGVWFQVFRNWPARSMIYWPPLRGLENRCYLKEDHNRRRSFWKNILRSKHFIDRNHLSLVLIRSLTKRKMNRIAVISIILSVLTIQASGKSDFALELLKKQHLKNRRFLLLLFKLGIFNFFLFFHKKIKWGYLCLPPL